MLSEVEVLPVLVQHSTALPPFYLPVCAAQTTVQYSRTSTVQDNYHLTLFSHSTQLTHIFSVAILYPIILSSMQASEMIEHMFVMCFFLFLYRYHKLRDDNIYNKQKYSRVELSELVCIINLLEI